MEQAGRRDDEIHDVEERAVHVLVGMRGAVHALAIVLVADVVWMICAALIDQKLASAQDSAEEGNRAARLRTVSVGLVVPLAPVVVWFSVDCFSRN